MRRLLIAEHNTAISGMLQQHFRRQCQVEIAADGDSLRSLLGTFRPDTLVMNLCLPGADAITLLESTLPHRPQRILIVTDFPAEYAYMPLMQLGVQGFLMKPFSCATAVRHITALEEQPAAAVGPVSATHVLLQQLGFSSHLDGYQQLCVGIPLFAQNPNQQFCKELYYHIAAACGNSAASQVEHSIRTAIRGAWSKRSGSTWTEFFPDCDRSPSNKVFISRLAQALHYRSRSA